MHPLKTFTAHQDTLKKLASVIHSQPAQQTYYGLSCGHTCRASGPSAPSHCPVCQKAVSDHVHFDTLHIISAIEHALAQHRAADRERELAQLANTLHRMSLDQCLRTTDGQLIIPDINPACSDRPLLSLTPKEEATLKECRTLVQDALHTTAITHANVRACSRYDAPENTPLPLRHAIYQQLLRFHQANQAPNTATHLKKKALFHRAMIAKLRQLSEATATVYAQCAHEQMRHAPEAEATPAIQTHCTISMETLDHPVYTDCGHLFEDSYIRRWLAHNNSCPCCRAPVQQLVSVPLRTKISHALKTPTHLPTLKAAIAPYHVNWPHVVGTALGNSQWAYQCVWSRTPNTRVNTRAIQHALNNDVETLSHFIQSKESKPTRATRCRATLFHSPRARVVSVANRTSHACA